MWNNVISLSRSIFPTFKYLLQALHTKCENNIKINSQKLWQEGIDCIDVADRNKK
jgi:hypothetical protein